MSWLIGLIGWKRLAAGVVGLALLAAIGVQSARLDHAKRDLGEARAALVDPATGIAWRELAASRGRDLAECVLARAVLTGAITRQNAAVAALKAEGERRAAESRAALSAARGEASRARREAAAILGRQPPADRCQGALDLIREP